MQLKSTLVAAAAAFALSGAAVAGPVLSDLTTDDYITVAGLDWAWASPVTSGSWGGVNELFQANLHAGWREATDAEWAARPDYSLFGGKCASKYWNSVFTHCDLSDGQGGFLSQHWLSTPDNSLDLWYVRTADDGTVPEPATLALVGLALAATGALRKKKAA